jgi:hypothetical protein
MPVEPPISSALRMALFGMGSRSPKATTTARISRETYTKTDGKSHFGPPVLFDGT